MNVRMNSHPQRTHEELAAIFLPPRPVSGEREGVRGEIMIYASPPFIAVLNPE